MSDWNWDQSGVFEKLILNRNAGQMDLQVLRYLGFVHLVTESGIHLYALLGVSLAFWKGVAKTSRLEVRESWIAAHLTGLGLCLAAWALSDWRVGLFRPFVSVSVRIVSQILGLRWAWWGPLVIALLADIVIFGAASSSGRLHYALAVCGGLWVWNHYQNTQGAHLKMAVVSWYGTALFDAWEIGIVSVFTPLWSVITIPIVAGIFFPLILLAQLGVWNSEVVLGLINTFMCECVRIAHELPGIVVVSRESIVLSVCLGVIAVFLSRRQQLLMILLVICVRGGSEYAHWYPVSGEYVQKNVGQGDAFIWKRSSGEGVTLIDTGDTHRVRDSEWLKFFFQHQILEIDEILFTHLDSDHASGVSRLERLIPIGECKIDERHLLKRESPCVSVPTVSPEDSAEMKVITQGNARGKGNSLMTGVWIRDPLLGEYLNLGDADEKREWEMYRALQRKWGSDALHHRILKATHHGSRYSTSRALLNAYDPQEVWISSGERNRYGHPSQRALGLFLDAGAQIRRTDQEGDLVREGPRRDFVLFPDKKGSIPHL